MASLVGVDEDDYRDFLKFQEFKRRAAQRAPAPSPSPSERTVGDLHAEWLETLSERAKRNRRSQGRHLKRPFTHRGQEYVLANMRPSECSKLILAAWQRMLLTTPSKIHKGKVISAPTVNQIRTGLQCCFRYFVVHGELEHNPLYTVPRVDGRDRQREGYATPADVERFSAALPYPGGWIAKHMFATGCRVGNLLALQKSQIDWAAKELILVVKGRNGGKPHRPPVPDQALEELRHLCAAAGPSPWVYPNPKDPTKPIPYSTFINWCRKTRKKLGMTLVPHEFRHGAAVDILDNDGDLTEVQYQLGHSDIKESARYARIRGKAIERLRERQNARFAK